jgi:hypothetical protein
MSPDQNQEQNSPQPTQPAEPHSLYPPPPNNMPGSSVSTPATPVAPPDVKKSRLLPLIIIAVVVLLAGAAGAYFVTKNNNKNKEIGGSVSLNASNANTTLCTPVISNAPDLDAFTTTYERFAKGVAVNNKSCIINLETSFFISHAKQTFGSDDWTSHKLGDRESMADDFSQLPANYDVSKFKQTDYTRGIILGESNPPATGSTLSYPVDLTKFSKSGKWQISVSMILDNGNIKVDDLVLEPQN